MQLVQCAVPEIGAFRLQEMAEEQHLAQRQGATGAAPVVALQSHAKAVTVQSFDELLAVGEELLPDSELDLFVQPRHRLQGGLNGKAIVFSQRSWASNDVEAKNFRLDSDSPSCAMDSR